MAADEAELVRREEEEHSSVHVYMLYFWGYMGLYGAI